MTKRIRPKFYRKVLPREITVVSRAPYSHAVWSFIGAPLCTVIDCVRSCFVSFESVRSSVRRFPMPKLAHNVKPASYQRYQRRIQVDAA